MNINNPLLKQIEAKNEARVPPELQGTYKRIVAAGEHVMYAPEAHKLMMQQMSKGNPAEAAGEGIAKLLAILINQSKKTLNMKAAIPAMTTLLCEGLDFLEQSGKITVDQKLIDTATQEMGSSIMQLLGVTPDKLQAMVDQKKARMAEPELPPAPPQPTPAPPPPGGLIQSAMGSPA